MFSDTTYESKSCVDNNNHYIKDLSDTESENDEPMPNLKLNKSLCQKKNNFCKSNLVCNIGSCKKRFRNRTRLEKHINSHFYEKRYICEYSNCCKVYKSKENLTLHFKNKHLEIKPYKCFYCNSSFSHRNGKIYHERKMHKNYMKFDCESN